MWEGLSLGQVPYENIQGHEVLNITTTWQQLIVIMQVVEYLKNGGRLRALGVNPVLLFHVDAC